MGKTKEKLLDINYLVAFVLSDVDIFLLREQDQETDKQKTFTTDEIRNQLMQTGQKIYKCMKENGIDIYKPLEVTIPITKFSHN